MADRQFVSKDRVRWALLTDGEVHEVLLTATTGSATAAGLNGRKSQIAYMEKLRHEGDFWDAVCGAAQEIDPRAVMVHGTRRDDV